MTDQKVITEHYRHGDLLNTIQTGIEELGRTPENISADNLAPVDEFHIGGRTASVNFLDRLGFSDSDHLLDVGCGLGGTARLAAERYQSRVAGVDLMEEYIETGSTLCSWVGLDHLIRLHRGDVLNLPFDDGTFTGAFMMHVGMNIEDKAALFAEIRRVLRPGATFGIYDVMQVREGEIAYPVPWASSPDASAIASPAAYRATLDDTGFEIDGLTSRHSFAVHFFGQLRENTAARKAHPLGPHILMGEDAPAKIQNMIANVTRGLIAPVEIIARKS